MKTVNQKKAKKFKWTEEAERAFNDIKKLLISPPVLKAPTPDGLFRLESDTSREGVGGTLLQRQGDEWVVIGYHSKRLPKSAKNFGVTELELTGLLVNIHGFMQLLCNRYFEVFVDHKAIEYMIKSKTKSPMTRLKTLLLKLSEYMIDLKYQKGSEMHTSNTLSRLHNFTDTPDQKDIIPLNFLLTSVGGFLGWVSLTVDLPLWSLNALCTIHKKPVGVGNPMQSGQLLHTQAVMFFMLVMFYCLCHS